MSGFQVYVNPQTLFRGSGFQGVFGVQLNGLDFRDLGIWGLFVFSLFNPIEGANFNSYLKSFKPARITVGTQAEDLGKWG